MDIAIETHNLSKVFDPPQGWRRLQRGTPTTAVRDVDLQVARGALFGLLGPNGAGKTTLVKMLCTLIAPTEGTGRVAGYDLDHAQAIRSAVGLVVTDERSFYWRLSGRRNLRFFAAMHGLFGAEAASRIDHVLDAVDLTAHADRWFSKYSTGMKQRLAIARALLHQPSILFLDEPSRSLDPTSTRRLHDLVLNLRERRGITVFLITHDLAEAEKLCTEVAVMHQGRIRVVGEPAGLRRRLQPQRRYALHLNHLPPDLLPRLRQLNPDLSSSDDPPALRFLAPDDGQHLQTILDVVRTHDTVHIRHIEATPPSLEEVFAHFTAQ